MSKATPKPPGDNGILFEGEKEHIFVSRGRLTGNLIPKIAADARLREKIHTAATALYAGPYGVSDREFQEKADWNEIKLSHMGNFFNCTGDGRRPISDVDSVQRSNTSCHLCNIALRLNRKLRWDPANEDFIDDAEATAMLARQQRKPYTIEA